MSLSTLAAHLKNEPGVWSLNPVATPPQPADDAHATGHGHGIHPPIPSYSHRLSLTVALDTVRLYNLAKELPNAADQKMLTDAAEQLFASANLATVPEEELVKLILGHWPLPAPARWLLRFTDAVDLYLTALKMPPASGGDLVTAAKARIKDLVDVLLLSGDDGGTNDAGGGHTN